MLPRFSARLARRYTRFYAVTVAAIITFGGLVSPILEVKLGLGGQSYRDFIANMHLPTQLAQVGACAWACVPRVR